MPPFPDTMNIPLTLELETIRASDSQRLRQLFEMAPVSLLLEDYGEVAQELVQLANEGVTDIVAHLRANRGATLDLIGKVNIVDANPPALAMLGVNSADELRGPILASTLNEEAIGAFEGQFEAIWNGDAHWQATFGGRDVFGRPVNARLGWAVPYENGRPDYAHVMVSMTDVSELLDTQRELHRLIAWKDQFTASVAHELRTPVTGLVGFAEVLCARREEIEPEELPEIFSILAAEAKELHRLVEDLLVAARSEAGELDIETERVCTRAMAEESARSAGSDIAITGDQAFATGDPVRIRQILRNLVTNAHRYGGPERSIEIGVADSQVFVDVCDNGPEIPPDQHDAIFEPFDRGGGKRVKASIGLGLSVARNLAHAQGGALVYLRRADHNVFRLTLPAA